MRNRITAFSLFAVTLALAAAAEARPAATTAPTSRPGRDPEAIFKRLDTDHDGVVSKTEFEVLVKRLADRRDKNGKAGGKGNGKGAGDGSQLFEKLDADHDGSLSPEEFKKISELRGATRGERGGKRGQVNA